MITRTSKGLYCKAGDFYIDPWRPVPKAVITHGHADHARPGSEHYTCHRHCQPILEHRLGAQHTFRALEYGEVVQFGPVSVSLHSAGHILGSAQVRMEYGGEVWVITGDYKRDEDPTCEPFEPVVCDTLITEATFALPIYRWPHIDTVVDEIYQWWQKSRAAGRAAVLFCYSLGKAQRVLAGLKKYGDDPVLLHGACVKLTEIYREAGIEMVPTEPALIRGREKKKDFTGHLIIAPPGANGTSWMKRFGDCSTGFCSGWMQLRGNRRRRGYDRGFVMSDHADWPSLLRTVKESQASRILATHGRTDTFVRYLNEQGIFAESLETAFGDDIEAAQEIDGVHT